MTLTIIRTIKWRLLRYFVLMVMFADWANTSAECYRTDSWGRVKWVTR